MKMPRSQCESENIQFVQELAEVDGPFESPININFRDLTKLELPSLVWNRGDTCPKKMKITNTGHTVIISGKWKCERPYLTGGPLAGKYVFSQIHFHWGQDDCRGSEHQVCGDGFPLEMHVAHFKTEYLTQECALREKDGMVVVVYLFKLQDEPNQSLKKIINLLPCVKQPSTSHAIDPRPILSFCNPFTDDYFMYWGSVVTSTCAHILLWIICREPFGISRDQVNEFRKIMDSCQQPIFRNSRDIQPLHKRNVFHVNASKHLDDPLLPVKKLLGCYCKESGENITATIQPPQDCKCQAALQNQEECEGDIVEYTSGNHCLHAGGVEPMQLEVGIPSGCFHHNQTYFVHRATVHSASLLVKRFGSEPAGNHRLPEKPRQLKVGEKLLSKSCCFLPLNECNKIKTEKRKTRGRRPFNSIRAFSQIMHSLEALKNQTFKKLKEIESINQEIKGMKSYCQGNEDKRWLRKIEKMMKRQKRFTIKSSQGCLSELKKLAKDCNLDRIFDCKPLPVNENNGKLVWLYNDEITKENMCSPNACVKQEEIPLKDVTKTLTVGKAIKFSSKAQKLIQSFFEDIQDTDELHQTVKKDLNLKKIKSFCTKQAGDSHSVSTMIKGFITPNMFVSGNLGNRFFTEVTTEEFENDETEWEKLRETENLLTPKKIIDEAESPIIKIRDNYKDETKEEEEEEQLEEQEGEEGADFEMNADEISRLESESFKPQLKESIVTMRLSRTSAEGNDTETIVYEDGGTLSDREKLISNVEVLSSTRSTTENKEKQQKKSDRFSSTVERDDEKMPCESISQQLLQSFEANYEEGWQTQTNEELDVQRSSSNLSTDSTETQRMIIAKIRRRRSRKDFWEQNSSDPGGKSYMSPYEKSSCKEFEGYYIHRKNQKTKKRKKKGDNLKHSGSSSREANVSISKWKSLTKAKFKLEIEKTNESLVDLAFENSIISPRRKKLKLESQKGSPRSPKESDKVNSPDRASDDESDVLLAIEARLEEDYKVSKAAEKKSPKGANEWKKVSKTITASSVESKASSTDRKEADEVCYVAFEDGNNTLNAEFPKHTESKSKVRSRSLAGISTEPRISTEIAQRLYLESLDDRRKNNKEVTDLRRQMESPRQTEDRPQTKGDLSRGTLTEIYDSDGEQKQQEISENISNKLEYNIGFFTTASSQVDEELMPKPQEIKAKNPVLKRCDAEKYQFLEKGPLELCPAFQERKEEYHEILHQTDSNKSFTKEASKGDSDPQNVSNKDLQTSVSYLRLKKNSPSRPHSAETLNSLTKTFKRKGKKRPHCCKRISRHYIRKNSSIIKKPHKTESKQQNFLSLTDQEQLKIISVNVAKYLKQKLIEEKKGLDSGKASIDNIEEAVFTKLKATQENKEDKTQKEAGANKDEKTKQNKIPTIKAKDKKREKVTRSESKTKIKSSKSPSEPKTEKPVCVLPKPANNFIKLNKQMAGKYKKRTPTPEKKVEPKQKQKPCTETAIKEETGKFKTRIPKKRVEKSPGTKPPEKAKTRPETPSSPKSQKLSPTRKTNKESRVKSPVLSKKTGIKAKEAAVSVPPSNAEEESRELVACEQNPTETALAALTLQKTPQEKTQHFVPAYTLTSFLPAPIEIVESQNRKVNRYLLGMGNPGLENYLPDVLYDNKGKKLTDGNDSLFKKELEYFIKLEMLDISANIEKSMNYVRSTLSQDYFGSNYIENAPADNPTYLDPYNKEIVLLKMKDVECTSSASDFVEEPDKYTLGKDMMGSKHDGFDKNRDIVTVKIPKESGDPGIISPTIVRERPEETNSDSSYDCKISITLNTNFNVEGEHKNATDEIAQNSEEGDSEFPGSDACGCQEANSNRQAVGALDESSSQSLVVKHHRRKRKENEISLEMKHKLLEILEGEIRREVGIKRDASSENSSEGLTFRWDDSDRNRSQSTESSCDNIEVLTQISDTMRQYLQSLKEKGQLVEIINESSDKESK